MATEPQPSLTNHSYPTRMLWDIHDSIVAGDLAFKLPRVRVRGLTWELRVLSPRTMEFVLVDAPQHARRCRAFVGWDLEVSLDAPMCLLGRYRPSASALCRNTERLHGPYQTWSEFLRDAAVKSAMLVRDNLTERHIRGR